MAGIPLTVRLGALEACRADQLVHRPLFDGAPREVPVAFLLEDGEPVTEERLESFGLEPDEAFTDAFEARADADAGAWNAQAVPVKGGGTLTILVREGESADVEDLLVPAILEDAARQLGAASLAVALPARGVLLAVDGGQKWQLVAAFSTAVKMQHERAGESALWPGVLRVEGGSVTGLVELSTVSLDAAAKRSRGGS